MIATPDATIRYATELERGVAVAAIQMKAAVITLAGLEQNEILAEKLGLKRKIVGYLFGHANRPPEGAQVLSTGGIRARLCEQRIRPRTASFFEPRKFPLGV